MAVLHFGAPSVYAFRLAFIATGGLLNITPGLDTALVLRAAASGGSPRGALAGLEIAAGCFGWATLVALPWGSGRSSQLRSFVPEKGRGHGTGAAFATGLPTTLLNPKDGVRLLQKSAVVRTWDRLSGVMFVAFGVGLALQSRRT